MSHPSYPALVKLLQRAYHIDSVNQLLGWDEQVNLPPASSDLRAEQSATLAELVFAARTDPAIGEALTSLEAVAASLTPDEQTVVRLTRKDFDRAVRLTPDFVARQARLSSEGYHAWHQARAKNDYASFAPFLEKHLALAQEEAALQGWGDRAYDYALDKHDAGLTAASTEAIFTQLRAGLLPLVKEIDEAAARQPAPALQGFPVADQQTFLREVTEKLGFDYTRGRIDVSAHPFCSGSGHDVRMTTRFNADAPLVSLLGAIHETGHGLYEQGMRKADLGTPLGQFIGMAVHESQSRMWENQVGRGPAFWQFFEPRFRELFAAQLSDISSAELYRAVNRVEPTLIRVDADEIHYNLHIMLRFELEQRLFCGDLSVADLPTAWNDLSAQMLGRRPSNDSEGVLQDVHWSAGAFGYFPSYCLGNLISAQLWDCALVALPGLEDDFAQGDFSRLLTWLQENVHHAGRRYDTLGLVEKVTGAPLDPKHLIAYLRSRYGSLYLG